MRLIQTDTASNGVKQFIFKINEQEMDSIQASLEMSRNMLGKNPFNTQLKFLRSRFDNVARNLRRELRSLMVERED